ncbi:MAG: Ig-like domain-containing protein, partial [Clostridia bacterium]|nr:Ig-like domain-containing protein [Clostridia bacterium]
GVAGSMVMDIDYQPWKEGAGIVTFSLDFEMNILKVSVRISLASASYGMFRTPGYSGLMDFSGVMNADKFRGRNLLRSYRDAKSEMRLYGELSDNPRGSSIRSGGSAMRPSDSGDPYDRVLAEKKIENVIRTVGPALIPVGDGSRVLYLRLDDDSTRGSGDCSSAAYSLIDWDGRETEPAYLEDDGTFDFGLKAARIGDGRVLAVWSSLDRSFGDAEVESIGEMLNCADIKYCVFDENGVPGEIGKLTSDYGFEGMPSIAYDESTGNVFVAYISTDYLTEGVTLTGENPEQIGNFLYNSYSNVCFKVLDPNGKIVRDYTKNEPSYAAYESANGSGALNGMRYLNTQIDRKAVQATIREVSAAALDGKAYVVYSLDGDRSVQTDEDRELYLVTCDLETMEQSQPILLSEEEKADTNPQLITYDGTVLMYWNQDGKLNCGDVIGYLNSTYDHAEYVANQAVFGVNNMGEIANAATSYFVTVQPDGNLCIVYVDWEETDEGGVPAVYFREYDPDYGTFTDEEGKEAVYGMWGNITKVASVAKDQDISEVAYVGKDRRMLISFKTTNKDEEGNIASCDSSIMLLKGGNREEMSFRVFPDRLPAAGEKTALAVTVRNLASLPSSKITVKADLIDKEKNETPLGTKVFEDHFESNDKVTALFEDFIYPEKPDDYLVRVTAWDDDLDDYPAVQYFRLPYSPKISFDSAELITRADGSFEFSVNVSNDGNKAFDGYIAAGYDVTKEDGEEKQVAFQLLTDGDELRLSPGEKEKKTLRFEVPDGLYDEDGMCELEVVAYANGEAAESEMLYLYRAVKNDAVPEDILLNADNGRAVLDEGQTLSLDGTIAPYDARSGYRIVYSVDEPSVASVDALGNVTAVAEGKATVTVSVVKEATSLFISDSYRAADGAGVPLEIDENGKISKLGEAGEETAVFEKTVEITVTGHTHQTEYRITEGADAEWTKGGRTGLSFKSSADRDKFVAVKVDEEIIDAENYLMEDDGTLTITASFLEKLDSGGHTLTIVSGDGEATTRFTVRKAGEDSPTYPHVGDSANLNLWFALIFISLGAVSAVFFLGRKRPLRKD